MKSILITGGCGFIGVNLIHYLLNQEGVKIRVLDDESIGKKDNLCELDVEFLHGDIRDDRTVRTALRDMDGVVHLAADTRVIDSIKNPKHNFEVNVAGTFNLLEQMRETGVRQLIYASTGGAILGEMAPPINESMVAAPMSPYGASKLAGEGYCSAFTQAYQFCCSVLRFSNVYGPRSYHKGSVVAAFIKRILKGEPLVVYGDGSQTRDFIYINDLCEGIRLAIEHKRGGVFQLGTGVPTSVNDLLKLIRELVGGRYSYSVLYERFRKGEILHTHCDITKAKKELGFEPVTTLSEGLKETWEWFLNSWQGKVND